jgi:hypothetical protein
MSFFLDFSSFSFPSSARARSRGADDAELVCAHIRLGPKHTSNYVVLPQAALAAAFHCIGILTYADGCWRMLAYAGGRFPLHNALIAPSLLALLVQKYKF